MGTTISDDACVPKEKSRSRPSRICMVWVRYCIVLWLVIIVLSSLGDHEGENDELPAAWDCVVAVRFRLRTTFDSGGITTRGRSLSFATCKGGSLVDPRLSCDMWEKALSLRLMGVSGELWLGNAMITASSLLAEGNAIFLSVSFFSSGLGWKSSL